MKNLTILLFLLILSSSIHAYTTVSSNINTTTWTAGTYYITTSIDVNSGQTLTINPGVVVKFAHGTRLYVPGTIDANGTDLSSNYVVFTSIDDNSYGETITGSDGVPSPGDWWGLQGYGEGGHPGQIYLDYTIIRYGGNASGADANLYWNRGSGNFSNSRCEYSATHGIQNRDANVTINNSTINNNGGNGVYIYQSLISLTPNIYNNTFTSNTGYATHIQTSRLGNISNNIGTGNGTNGFGISGTISSNQTWTGYTGSFPIILLGRVEIDISYTLTIPASTIIKAETEGEIHVGGIIDVNGGNSTAVIFTSYKDDTYGGDTYGDGSSTSPAAGDWKGIVISSSGNYSNPNSGQGNFDYCIIRYGGNASTSYDANLAFTISGRLGIVNGCVIEKSANNGIYLSQAYVKVRNSRVIDNGTNGIYAKSGYYNGDVYIGKVSDHGNNRFTNNSGKAILNDGYTIDALYNYWGVISDPEIAGMINNLSGGSVAYDPWLSSDPTVVPTPVELTSFTAASINSKTIQLNWQTATEVNNYGFEVQRTVGQISNLPPTWENIIFIEGHGNSNSPKEYSFVDTSELTGIVQYRLKQIDTDGSFEYSDIVEIEIGLPTKFKLSQNYPNPFNPSTTISYALPYDSKVRVEIFNTLGQRVDVIANGVESAGLHSTLWDAGHLSSGIYIIRINATSVSGGDNFVKSIKIILMK